MMRSGSWRRIARRPDAKVMPLRALTAIWTMPSSWYSIGSSMVMIFSSPVASSEIVP